MVRSFKNFANENINRCNSSLTRIKNGIKLLIDDNDAYESFVLANQAMLMQRYHTDFYVKNKREADSVPSPNFPEKYSEIDDSQALWRPFQLAFILLNVISIANPSDDSERELADLLWFPTGGGKTKKVMNLHNDDSFPVTVRILTRGDLAPYIQLSDNGFTLEPNETKQVDVYAIIPHGFQGGEGKLTGTAKVLYLRS